MSDTGDAMDDATLLARRMAALPEAAMRQYALRRYIEETAPTEAVAVLEQIHRRGDHGGPPYDIALLALTALLNGDHVPYERIAQLYEAAKAQSRTALLDLFFSPQATAPPELPQVDRALTLGHRKTLARRGDRSAIHRLLHQPEGDVLPHLLQNPRLVERDVVAVAARRPTDPQIQRLLAGTPRWIARYRVKKALVLNPHTPSDISLRLLPFLQRADLRQLRGMASLTPALRSAAERLLDD
jgi:hypothetical protein